MQRIFRSPIQDYAKALSRGHREPKSPPILLAMYRKNRGFHNKKEETYILQTKDYENGLSFISEFLESLRVICGKLLRIWRINDGRKKLL